MKAFLMNNNHTIRKYTKGKESARGVKSLANELIINKLRKLVPK